MSGKAAAKAPANIALIKFWGKKNEKLRLPMNNSISLNLSEVYTVTTVEFDDLLKRDRVILDGIEAEREEIGRVSKHLDRVRLLAKVRTRACVESRNNFPKGTGIASSASGFAALSLASTAALGLKLTERQLSVLARLGSGSACRSIPDGWVEWKAGDTSDMSYAYSLHDQAYWDICDLVCLVGRAKKKVSSSEGHLVAGSSPFYRSRIHSMKDKIREIKRAIKRKDFTKMGEITEAEAVNMHAVMMTSDPPLFYWTPATLELMLAVSEERANGLESYFTIDAGPNVHVICRKKDVGRLTQMFNQIKGIEDIIVNQVARGAHLV